MKFLGPPSSGSVSDLTYSRNRGGQYTRSRNGRGGTGNSWFAGFSAAWSALTNDQRQAWNQFALGRLSPDRRLGGLQTLTGFNWFCRQNAVVNAGGGTFLNTDPIDVPPEDNWTEAVLVSAAWSGSNLETTVTFPPGTSGLCILQSSGVVTPGTMSGPGRGKWWKWYWRFDWVPLSVSPLTVSDFGNWQAIFGAASSGDWMFVRMLPVTIDFRYGGPQVLRIQKP